MSVAHTDASTRRPLTQPLPVYGERSKAILLTSPVHSLHLPLVRIIAGEFGGRKLLAPPSDATRPITDRAKQSLFDVLAPDIPDALVYDCFAGTGSMGLECLSRGANFCTFFEAHRPTVARLNQNIVALGVGDRSRIVPGDLFRWFNLSTVRPTSTEASSADIVFLDPPYRFLRDHSDEILQLVLHLTHSHLRDDAIVIFRHSTSDELELPNLARYDLRQYGEMSIELLRRRTTSEAAPASDVGN
jgi:16S rRNA (guanine966-N2)-methyltransferase